MGALKTRAVLNEAYGKVWGSAGNRVWLCRAGRVVVGWGARGVVGCSEGCGLRRGGLETCTDLRGRREGLSEEPLVPTLALLLPTPLTSSTPSTHRG